MEAGPLAERVVGVDSPTRPCPKTSCESRDPVATEAVAAQAVWLGMETAAKAMVTREVGEATAEERVAVVAAAAVVERAAVEAGMTAAEEGMRVAAEVLQGDGSQTRSRLRTRSSTGAQQLASQCRASQEIRIGGQDRSRVTERVLV